MAEKALSCGGISSDSVKKATGKSWDEWLKILDMIDAARMSHKEIAAWIYSRKLANGWWSQMVTVGYEQARGLRDKYGKAGGKAYSLNVTATINTSLKSLYRFVNDEKLRKSWLREKIEVTSSTKEKYFHAKWKDGTKLSFGFYFKGVNKSQLALEHSKLESTERLEEMRVFWKKRFAKLKQYLEENKETAGKTESRRQRKG